MDEVGSFAALGLEDPELSALGISAAGDIYSAPARALSQFRTFADLVLDRLEIDESERAKSFAVRIQGLRRRGLLPSAQCENLLLLWKLGNPAVHQNDGDEAAAEQAVKAAGAIAKFLSQRQPTESNGRGGGLHRSAPRRVMTQFEWGQLYELQWFATYWSDDPASDQLFVKRRGKGVSLVSGKIQNFPGSGIAEIGRIPLLPRTFSLDISGGLRSQEGAELTLQIHCSIQPKSDAGEILKIAQTQERINDELSGTVIDAAAKNVSKFGYRALCTGEVSALSVVEGAITGAISGRTPYLSDRISLKFSPVESVHRAALKIYSTRDAVKEYKAAQIEAAEHAKRLAESGEELRAAVAKIAVEAEALRAKTLNAATRDQIKDLLEVVGSIDAIIALFRTDQFIQLKDVQLRTDAQLVEIASRLDRAQAMYDGKNEAANEMVKNLRSHLRFYFDQRGGAGVGGGSST